MRPVLAEQRSFEIKPGMIGDEVRNVAIQIEKKKIKHEIRKTQRVIDDAHEQAIAEKESRQE